MSSENVFSLVSIVASAGHSIWASSIIVNTFFPREIFKTIISELCPLIPVFIFVHLGIAVVRAETSGQLTAAYVFATINFLTWMFLKDRNDNDRWKRRRRKLAQKISQLASGRLAVEPA